MASIERLLACGQSLWLDYVDRNLIHGGGLARLVDEGLRGVTSNPTIFHQAITGTDAYDEAILDLLQADHEIDAETLYEWLAIQDIQSACDALAPVFEATQGTDGFVSRSCRAVTAARAPAGLPIGNVRRQKFAPPPHEDLARWTCAWRVSRSLNQSGTGRRPSRDYCQPDLHLRQFGT